MYWLLLLLLGFRLGRGCPASCSCLGQWVDCSSRGLLTAPTDIPGDVRNLSLAHNTVTVLPLGYFSCYRELLVLSLRNNSITDLPLGLFFPLKKLTVLDLSYNNLTQVTSGLLQPVEKLSRLVLSHNPGLSVISSQALSGLTQLQHLDLSYNGLTSLDLETVKKLPALISLQLAGNPWLCGCNMEPLLNFVIVTDSGELECSGPNEIKGIRFFSLTDESFRACRLSLTTDDYLFIVFVGFVVSIASVATNFLLGITANYCHRWSKASEDEEM
uniref:Leucine rich repeat containing 55 n=1 Tax=Callorhinchus milii TaxID=7868 RepID=A0A4W3JRL5_CALMI